MQYPTESVEVSSQCAHGEHAAHPIIKDGWYRQHPNEQWCPGPFPPAIVHATPSGDVTFAEITAQSDLSDYAELSAVCLSDADRTSPESLQQQLRDGLLRSWSVSDAAGIIGFCSVVLKSPHLPQDWRGAHLLESFVAPKRRRQGFGSTMLAHRIQMFGNYELTTSISPDNEQMKRLAPRFGFRPGLPQDPWITWHRLPTRSDADAHYQKVLIIWPHRSVEHPGIDGKFAPSNAFTEATELGALLNYYADRGCYAEHYPAEAMEGKVLRGLWPDPAAYSTVVRITRSHRVDTPETR